MAEAPPRKRYGHAAAAVLVCALALLARCWGLEWGLPHAGRFYPYHPDESVLLHAVGSINPLWGDFAPGFYNYGTLYITLCRLAYDFLAGVAGWGPVPSGRPFEQWVGDFARLLLVGRWVTVLLGTATVWLTFALGRRLFGSRAGLLGAAFLAAAPLPVFLGHYMTVDVPAAFFTTLSLLLAAAACDAAGFRRTALLTAAAGFAAGLAIGVKYSGAPVILAAAVPLWRMHRERAGSWPAAALGAVAACAAGFLLATPGALLEPERFRADLLYELGRNREGQGLVFRETPPALLYHALISLPVGLEWPLYALCVAGLAVSVMRRERGDVLLWLFLVPSLMLLVPAQRKFIRYVTPLLPPLALLGARAAVEGATGPRRRLWGTWTAAAGGAALAGSIAHIGLFAAPDARDRAAAYLRERVGPADIVALGADPWYYTPPLHPTTGCVKVAALYGGPPVWDRDDRRPHLYPLPEFTVLAPSSMPPEGALPPARLAQYRPRFVLLTDFEYEDPERIRRAEPGFQHGVLVLQESLRNNFRLAREFRPRPSLPGFTWWSIGIPPHDWRYPMPTVRVYERLDGATMPPEPSLPGSASPPE